MFHLRLRRITCCTCFFFSCEKEYFDSLIQVFESVVVQRAILDFCWYKSAHIICGFSRMCLVSELLTLIYLPDYCLAYPFFNNFSWLGHWNSEQKQNSRCNLVLMESFLLSLAFGNA